MFKTEFVFNNDVFKTKFVSDNDVFNIEFVGGGIHDTATTYKGEHTVTPSRKAKVLETANKVLSENITIVAIPYSEVSNLGGGKTFYIAKEN